MRGSWEEAGGGAPQRAAWLRGVMMMVVMVWGAVGSTTCPQSHPGPADCATSRTDRTPSNSGVLSDPGVLNCSFDSAGGESSTLCHYTQGCLDSNMGQWEASKGTAGAHQVSYRCSNAAINSYSVLESPWLTFSSETCISYMFQRFFPYRLNIFFITKGTQNVTTVVDNGQQPNNGLTFHGEISVPPLVGKIVFRAYGGGGSTIGNSIKLSPVSVRPGRCNASGNGYRYHLTVIPYPGPWSTPLTPAPRTDVPASPSPSSSTLSVTSPPPSSSSASSIQSATTAPPPSSHAPHAGTSFMTRDRLQESADNTAVTVGAVVGGVAALLLGVIIGVVVFKRKRRERESADSSRLTEDSPSPDRGKINAGFKDLSPSTFPAISASDDYSVIRDTQQEVSGPPSAPAETCLLDGPPEDGYSRIRSTLQSGLGSTDELYAKVQKKHKTQREDSELYSTVNKAAKNNSTRQNCPSNLNNAATGKPTIPQKPTSSKESDSPRVTGDESSGSGAATRASDERDGYSTVNVPGEAFSFSAALVSSADPGDYNALTFHQAGRTQQHWHAPINPYDHVTQSPDQDYSRTQESRGRNVVIDSDYDHVTHPGQSS